MILLFVTWCLTTGATCVGIFAVSAPLIQRRIVPLAGGFLVGVALYCVLPELAARSGWPVALAGTLAGAALLQAFNRYIYPLCPVCDHSHDHAECATSLHGFAVPLLVAVGVHCVFDGWTLLLSTQSALGKLSSAMLLGLLVHKLPEGLVLGLILRAAMRSRWWTLLGAAASQSAMFVALLLPAGAAIKSAWANAWFALATGSFLFLGAHALHSEWRASGPRARLGWLMVVTPTERLLSRWAEVRRTWHRRPTKAAERSLR